jgi:thiamine transport system permease protein
MKTRIRPSHFILAGIPLLFLGVFYFYPLLNILKLSLAPEGTWDFSALSPLMRSGYYAGTLWFTFWQAALSTILTLVTALPVAWVFIRFDFPGKRLIQSLIAVPFVLPTVVVGAAFQSLLGPQGIINTLLADGFHLASPPVNLNHSVGFILIAHVFYNFSIAFRMITGFGRHLNPALIHAAQLLGASPWQSFRQITFPLLVPVLLSSAMLIFVFCFSSFGVILILGGPRLATVEVEIYRQAVNLFHLPLAAALSAIQILFTFACLWVYTNLQRQTAVTAESSAYPSTARNPSRISHYVLIGASIGWIVVFEGSPLAALILQSVITDTGFSPIHYQLLFIDSAQSLFYVPPIQALKNSIGVALCSLTLSLGFGFPAAMFLARTKTRLSAFLDPLFMLPLSTSAVTLGFGFIISLDKPPLNLRSSWLLLPIAHTLTAFPFVIRCLLPALRSIHAQLGESAAILGASPFGVWKSVDLPLVSRALAAAAVFAFTISMGEFGATSFIARPQTPTLPIAIYRFLGTPGTVNYGQAMAMSCLLMLITAAGFLVLDRMLDSPRGIF